MSITEVLPLVTVVMPVRNEEAFIARSLGAVLEQDYPAERMQVLVADGMSDDGTRSVVAEVAAAHPGHSVEVVDNRQRIAATGLNAALERARGDVVIRVDGHAVVERDYVRQCVAALAESGADNVGGPIETISEGPVGEAIALAMSSRFGVGNSQFRSGATDGAAWVDTVPFGAWPREVFARLGQFDPELVRNQDDEFNYRLRAGGGRILLSDRIRSRYYSRSSLRGLFRQYRQYGFWKVRVLQKHPRQMSARQFAPPVLVAGLAGGLALAPFSRTARRLWGALAAAYVLADLGASVSLACREGVRHMRYLPVVFGALHIGFGAGFLHGLVHFRDRWRRRPGAGDAR